ncbi:hypothetical protein IMZ31_18900 (plasmid) [Pontibacillus sp. ALD_SL1]|uniref:hypothetical protein n=1 Tax=Pontibacillus sp. ALD_SL1 TaxID=2777185 RepID=UPI001A970E2E|nr:hypothetical protein [Pontibacillus sp. ALD_SL1]QST02618.1 hypothetical protein IMZ31_18900 [Pontibacillus sp. ALD_SL1]
MKPLRKEGLQVKVSGPVVWGDDEYRVASEGKIVDWGTGTQALVNLEQVGPDFGVTTFVDKDIITPL